MFIKFNYSNLQYIFLLGCSHPFLPNRNPRASRNSKKRWVRSVMNCDGYNCGCGGGRTRRKWFSAVYTSLCHLSGGIRTIIGWSKKVHWTWFEFVVSWCNFGRVSFLPWVSKHNLELIVVCPHFCPYLCMYVYVKISMNSNMMLNVICVWLCVY